MEKMIHGNKIHVLIFPAGEVNAAELHDALCSCVNIEVYILQFSFLNSYGGIWDAKQ